MPVQMGLWIAYAKTTIEAPKIDDGDKVLSEIQKTTAYSHLTAINAQLKHIPLTAKGWNIEAIEYVFLLPNQLRLMYQVGLGGSIESTKALVNLLDNGSGTVEITFFDQNKKCDIILPLTAHNNHSLPDKASIRATINPTKGFEFISQLQLRNINYQLGRKTPISLGDHREHFMQEVHFGALKPMGLAQLCQIAQGFDNFGLKCRSWTNRPLNEWLLSNFVYRMFFNTSLSILASPRICWRILE